MASCGRIVSTFRSRSADRGLKCHPGTISELCSGSLHESLARDGTRSTALYIHVYFPAHACNGECHACHCVPRKLAPFNQQDTGRCNPQNALERRSIALNELRHRIQCIAAVGLRSSIVLAGYLPAGIAIASDMRSSATGRADGPSSSSLASQATLSAGSVASTSRQSPANTRIIRIPRPRGFPPTMAPHSPPSNSSQRAARRQSSSRTCSRHAVPKALQRFQHSGLCHVSYITIHISSHARARYYWVP